MTNSSPSAPPAQAQDTLPPRKTVRGLWLWTLLAAACFARMFRILYMPAQGGRDVSGNFIGHDFVNVWTGAKLTLAGKVTSIFSRAEYNEGLHKLLGADYPNHTFSYPPHILLLQAVFGLTDYFPALALWTAAGLAVCLLALKRAGGTRAALLAFAFSPAACVNYLVGHNGFFTAALFLGGLLLSETSPVLAGVLIGCLTVKPQLGVIIPFILVIRRNWKCIGSAAATTAALAGLSMLLWGLEPWRQFVTEIATFQASILTAPVHSLYYIMMPGVAANALLYEQTPESHAVWMALQVAAALWAGAATLLAVKREGLTPRTLLMAALAAIIITPYSFAYDLAAVSAALAAYLSRVEVRRPQYILYGLLWALPLSMYEMRYAHLPLPSVILLAAFACLWLDRPAKAAA